MHKHIRYYRREVTIDGKLYDYVIAYDETGTVLSEAFIPYEFE